jgi:hypothetical protein
MSEKIPATTKERPLIPDYTVDLQDRTTLRGYHLLNMMRGLLFDAKLSAEWFSSNPPQPLGKLWQETKNLIVRCKVPYTNLLNPNRRALDSLADIDAAELLRCVRNHPRPLFEPLLAALLKWKAAGGARSFPPIYDEVFAIIAPEKARRLQSHEGWNRNDARAYCKVVLPGATNKLIDAAYQSAEGKFEVGRKSGNGAR